MATFESLILSPEEALRLRQQAELAIGEYVARGRKVYREMPLARVLKALHRFGIAAEDAPRALQLVGARVIEVPSFVAKYNYRVTFPDDVLARCRRAYEQYRCSET
jgi:transcriptional regulator of nitric oxide reductase